MTKAFITGISGFVGGHISDYLVKGGWYVSGQDLIPSTQVANSYQFDLHDSSTLQKTLVRINPDVIFHLAGRLKAEESNQYYDAHVLGTVSLMDAIVKSGIKPIVLIASSSAVYGSGFGSKPITESFKLRPSTQYAASKAAQEIVARHYFYALGLPVICLRSFNLLGPGLSPQMACSSFARQIAEAEKLGLPAKIFTGALGAQRDFVDVRDAVRAYALVSQKGQAGQTYNVASGRPVSIQACLELLLKQARVSIDVVLDPARMQKNDIPVQVGSAKRLHELTGWEPEIAIEQSLSDLLNDWRQRV